MAVKIARLRNGEDIIADIKEVVEKEKQSIAAIQFDTPFMVGLEESVESMFSDNGTSKISSPRVRFFPWAPLAKENILYIDPNEIICIYDAHQQIADQYEQLKEAMQHGRDDREGATGTDTAVATESDFIKVSGGVPDWEIN